MPFPENSPSLWWYFNEVRWRWLKSLKRRSQRAFMSWEKFTSATDRFFPSIRILHPLPCHRFDARTRGRRSYAGAAGGVIPVRCNPHHQGIGEPLMTVLTVNNLPAATHGETVRCLFAIELSKMSWVIAFNTPLSKKISRRTLTGCKWKRLLELIEEVRTRVSRETGRAVEVISCYEAGYDGFWLHRQLEAHGIRNYVIDPASLQVDRRARRVKTDRIDTERLLRSLMAYLRGEPKVWSVVRVPSIAEEDARRLHRERDRLVSERVQHVNRIKGLCALHGIYDYQPLRPQAISHLEQLRTAQGISLPPRLKSEIKRELQRLELVVEMIATLEAERDAIVEDEASTHVNAKKIQNLSESVRRLQAGLHSFLSMRRIEARRKKASAFRLRFSQSLASLRQRLSHAMVRSTIQRFGRTTNPLT